LTELSAQLDMTRFGTMKHLRVLEEAGLVVTRREGREKRHFLNAVPIQMIYDRWVSKYSARIARGLTTLKRTLERE
jgi:DNA-binding transcriptional ArsR family regulator